MRRRSVTAVALWALAGCSGGGGGGGTPGPVPTATPTTSPCSSAPSLTPNPVSTGVTTLSIQSSPQCLAVSVAVGSGAAQALHATPTTYAPAGSNFASTVSIAPSNGNAPYTFVVDQRSNGTHTLLYDQSADTTGSIGSISASSVVRRTIALRPNLGNVPRSFDRGSRGREHFSANHLVVRYRVAALQSEGVRGADIERAAGIARAFDVGFVRGGLVTRVLEIGPGRNIDAVAAGMRARADVASVNREPLYSTQTTTAVMPNDTHFNDYQQWDMFDVKAPNAWGYTLGKSSVQIALIDTGVDLTLADLASKIGYSESILNGTIVVGGSAAQDTDGHGTNVAGIAAAETDDRLGFAGTGYNVGLQVYKVFPNAGPPDYTSQANSSDVAKAIYEAVAHGAKIINLSLGSCQAELVDSMQLDAVDYALSQNVNVVAASGNERSGMGTDSACKGGGSTIDFPAAFDGVVSVGATSLDDTAAPENPALATEKVASYSNAGPGLTVVAPGGDPDAADLSSPNVDVLHWVYNLYSTTVANPAEQCTNKSDCSALFAGTSQATPHVSAAIALMLSLDGGLSPSRIRSIIATTADDIGDPYQGNGRLDIYRALAAVTGDPKPPQAPTNENFVAFAYTRNGSNTPQILDVTFPHGVPVAHNGTFRIADVPPATTYEIGVWYDANGDGVVDAGDYFGNSASCSSSAPCTSAAGIVAHPVTSGFTLP